MSKKKSKPKKTKPQSREEDDQTKRIAGSADEKDARPELARDRQPKPKDAQKPRRTNGES